MMRIKGRRWAEARRERPAPIAPSPNADQVKRARIPFGVLLLLLTIAVFYAYDRGRAKAEFVRFVMGESYRAVLTQTPEVNKPFKVNVTYKKVASGLGRRGWELTLVSTDVDDLRSPSVVENLALWFANLHAADPEDARNIESLQIDLTVPSLPEPLQLALHPSAVRSNLLTFGEFAADLDLHTLGTFRDFKPTPWSVTDENMLHTICNKVPVIAQGYRGSYRDPKQPPQPGFFFWNHPWGSGVRLTRYEYWLTMRVGYRQQLPLSISFESPYWLQYADYMPKSEPERNENDCIMFRPHMLWPDQSKVFYDPIARKLDAPFRSYVGEKGFAGKEQYDRLSAAQEINVGKLSSLPGEIPLSHMALFLSISTLVVSFWASSRLRTLAAFNPALLRIVFFGTETKALRLSWLDGPHFRFMERTLRTTGFIAACVTPLLMYPILILLVWPDAAYIWTLEPTAAVKEAFGFFSGMTLGVIVKAHLLSGYLFASIVITTHLLFALIRSARFRPA